MKRSHFPSWQTVITFCICGVLVSGFTVARDITPSSPVWPNVVWQDVDTGINTEACANPANPIVAENCQPGTLDWLVENAASDIEGYASDTSVNVGGQVDFFINTTAPGYTIDIYRIGYYGGLGARLMDTIPNLAGTQQPACYNEFDTGLTSCATWEVSYTLPIPADWVSGVFIAKLTRPDTGGENYILFVVRDDERPSDILYQTATTTFHAYNAYGGKSVYVGGARNACPTVTETDRAAKVSFNRPYQLASMFGDNFNIFFHAEFPMVHWLEGQGYDLTYITNEDTHRSGLPGADNLLLDHQIFLSVGHDEYWTQEMRDAVTAARDSGVSLGFFSSNVAFWRMRYEDDPVTGEPMGTMVTYKSAESGPADPSGISTSTWRDPDGPDDPENSLVGIMYVGGNYTMSFPLRVDAELAEDPVYRHTALQSLEPGTYANIGKRLIGWEWDTIVDNGQTPEGLTLLANSQPIGTYLLDAGRDYSNMRVMDAHITRYTADSGAIVFATGTNRWTFGLSWYEPNPLIQQITYNIFADMGVQPSTPSDILILDSDTSGGVIPLEENAEVYGESDQTPPVISNVEVTATEESFVVRWDTDVPTTGQIWIGRTPENIKDWSQSVDTDYTTSHMLSFENLNPNTLYYYGVVSSTPSGATAIIDDGQVTTSQASLMKRMRLAVEPVYYPTRCWVIANTPLAVALGIGAAVVSLGVVAFTFTRIRRRFTSRA